MEAQDTAGFTKKQPFKIRTTKYIAFIGIADDGTRNRFEIPLEMLHALHGEAPCSEGEMVRVASNHRDLFAKIFLYVAEHCIPEKLTGDHRAEWRIELTWDRFGSFQNANPETRLLIGSAGQEHDHA